MVLVALPAECLTEILANLPARSICAVGLACKELGAVVQSPHVWRVLCERHWLVDACSVTCARQTYEERFSRMREVSGVEVTAPNPWADLISPFRATWTGSADDSHLDTSVGVAHMCSTLAPWPFGGAPCDEELLRVAYFEVRIVNAGEHGYIGVGWCTPSLASASKQPGWTQGSYGYHGDDGRAYHASGWGRPFGPQFSTGATVGSGLVLPVRRDGAAALPPPFIFYTLNGEIVGTAFRNVRSVSALRPAVGLHSHGEEVELVFGGCAEMHSHPPSHDGTELVFDIAAHLRRLQADMRALVAGGPDAPVSSVPPPLHPSVEGGAVGVPRLGVAHQSSSHADDDGASDSDDGIDEGYADLIRRITDTSDDSDETRAELVHFLQASFFNLQLGERTLADLDIDELRQICQLVMVEMVPPPGAHLADGQEASSDEHSESTSGSSAAGSDDNRAASRPSDHDDVSRSSSDDDADD